MNNYAEMENKKKCPYCAELIMNEAIFCKHCQKSLEEISSSEDPIIKDSSLENSKQEEIPILGTTALGLSLFSFALPSIISSPFSILGFFLGIIALKKQQTKTGTWALIFSVCSIIFTIKTQMDLSNSVQNYEQELKKLDESIKIEQSIK